MKITFKHNLHYTKSHVLEITVSVNMALSIDEKVIVLS